MGRNLRVSYPKIAEDLLRIARTLRADHEHTRPQLRDAHAGTLEAMAAGVLGWNAAPPPPKSHK